MWVGVHAHYDPDMADRGSDDVWEEIRAKASRLFRTQTPVETLDRRVENVITEVADDTIGRRSSAPRGDAEQSLVRRSDVARVWTALQVEGECVVAGHLAFACALVGRLTPGVATRSDPLRLAIEDRELAERPWASLASTDIAAARHALVDTAGATWTWREGDRVAPHKHLVLLLALNAYRQGVAPRWFAFSSVEARLRELLSLTWDNADHPEDGYWRLRSSGIWDARVADGRTSTAPPPLPMLRAEGQAGFTDFVDAALWYDESLAQEVIDLILAGFFTAEQQTKLRAHLHLTPQAGSPAMNLSEVLAEAMDLLATRTTDPTYWASLRPILEQSAPTAVKEMLGPEFASKGSTGLGNAAMIPWVAVFAPGTEASPRHGIYAVYLFAEDGSSVYLSLNQAAEQLGGGEAPLRKRAQDIRRAVGPADDYLTAIDLKTTANLGRKYAAGSAYAVRYQRGQVPPDAQLESDLRRVLVMVMRSLESGLDFDPVREPVHVLLKWSAGHEPNTVGRHRDVAQHAGSVWWGKFGKPEATGMGAGRLAELKAQIASGTTPTHAYLYQQGETWQTDLEELTTEPGDVDDARLPGYYGREDCNLFARLSHFVLVDEPIGDRLVLANDPDPGKLPGALGNQTNPLFVYEWRRPEGPTSPPPPPPPPVAALDFAWLQQQTLWTREALEEVLDSLQDDSPQVILAGPPGTGKTWVAERIARYLTNDAPLCRRVVQFHPTYGYEEFVEGLRPELQNDTQLAFRRVDGEVLELAREAAGSDGPYVLVIDEMNRANVPESSGN